MRRTAADDLLISNVHDALEAEKQTRAEIERVRLDLSALERQRAAYVSLARTLCPHTDTYVNKGSATGSPKFRRELRWAHFVMCKTCGVHVDDAPVDANWHWD